MQRMIRSIRDIEVIAPNLKFRHTGVTSTIKALLPAQSKHLRIASLGVGLPADWLQITWRGLFRRGWQPPPNRPFRIWHARRNNEMIIGWLLRVPSVSYLARASQQRDDHRLASALRFSHATAAGLHLGSP